MGLELALAFTVWILEDQALMLGVLDRSVKGDAQQTKKGGERERTGGISTISQEAGHFNA